MKKSRWSGRSELWIKNDMSSIIVRSSEFMCQKLELDKKSPNYWDLVVFKKAYTFDFYNGSAHLREHGYKLVERL